MKKKLLTLSFGLLSLAFANQTYAQRQCGVVEYHEMLKAEDPNFEENQSRIEDFTQRFIDEGGHLSQRAVVTIPVVVHVVYNTTAENISDAQIQSQIAILNADFRKLNADASLIPAAFAGVASDVEIQFCLATVDPNGAATTGIVRKSTTVSSFSSNNAVKYTANGGSNAWPAGSYLNLWVCDLGTSLLGYAQFPGGAAATDGVVCTYKAFGNTGTAAAPFNKGRTATHEVGHWLNLRHIWGDATCGSDLVNDTPTHNTANYGCPSVPHYSTCSGAPQEQTMNYMDYTDDACMYMFTAGQKARATALFASGGARASLLTSAGCGTGTPVACAIPSGLATSAITTSGATLSWSAVSGATSYDVQYRVAAGTWSTGNVASTSANLTGLSAATGYEWSVRANCASGISAYSGNATFTTSSTTTTTCTNDSYETNETFATAKTLTVNTTFSAMKICGTDVDWFKFNSSTNQKKVRVRLTNLPADYDLELYNSAGTLLGRSENGGTTNEGLYYNASSTGTYYVKVYGYNGAASNTAYSIICERTKNNYTSAGRLDGEDESTMELSTSLAFTAFPNPTNDMMNLTVNGGTGDLITIKVYDMSGRIVQALTSAYGSDGVNVHFDMSSLKGGLYLIEVNNGEERTTQRVMRN
jgi:hypothetical protein